MATLTDLTNLKKKVEQAKADAARAAGALDQAMSRLEREFECETLDDAETLLAKTEEEAGKAEREFDRALKKFEEEYGDEL